MHRRPGFTLIELLVVIAVILILAALVMPVLDRGTRQARRVACISNMRQMHSSFAAYAQDNGQHVPKSTMEYYKIIGLFDSVPALKPYVPDPRILYCTLINIGPLPNIDGKVGAGGDYVGWNHYGAPGANHVLSNIAVYFNPMALHDFGAYDENVWPVGRDWRHNRAPLISHRRIMRFNLHKWDAQDWRCQNWYPHGTYHDVLYGDGRNETHSAAEWQAKPRLWFDWGGGDRHNLFY